MIELVNDLEVDRETYESLLQSSIRVMECPCCGHSAEIIVSVPVYGRTGARVVCPSCGVQTRYEDIHGCYFEKDGSRMATPITPDTMMKGVLEAIRHWNGMRDRKSKLSEKEEKMITKRLTARDEKHKGNAYFPECFKEPCDGSGCKKENCPFLTQVCEKLAYYEDKYPITEMPAVDKMPAEQSKGENK